MVAERAEKTWTKSEIYYLKENWGTRSIGALAKTLKTTENAVKLRASRLKLGPHLAADGRISLQQLYIAIYGSTAGGGYSMHRLIDAGIPFKKHRTGKSTVRVINMEDFWEWAKENKHMLDFSRFEPLALGAEPDWVKLKRKLDFEKRQRTRPHNKKWTQFEEAKLRQMLKAYKYTYSDLSKELSRSEGAIKRRILTLGIKERPLRNPVRSWTDEEVNILLDLREQGYDWSQIGERLGRTALTVRGKYERLQNPKWNTREYRDNSTSRQSYNGIYSMSPTELRASIEENQETAVFSDAPPLKGENINK